MYFGFRRKFRRKGENKRKVLLVNLLLGNADLRVGDAAGGLLRFVDVGSGAGSVAERIFEEDSFGLGSFAVAVLELA